MTSATLLALCLGLTACGHGSESRPNTDAARGMDISGTSNTSGTSGTDASSTGGTGSHADTPTNHTNTNDPRDSGADQSEDGSSGTPRNDGTTGGTDTSPSDTNQGNNQSGTTEPGNGTQSGDEPSGDSSSPDNTSGSNKDDGSDNASRAEDTSTSTGNSAANAQDDSSSANTQTPDVGTQHTDVCADILAHDTPLISGMDKHPAPATARPAAGTATEDPIYRSCVVRITDQAGQHPQRYWTNSGTGRQAFNADSSYFILKSSDGYWRLHSARSGQVIKQLTGPEGDAEPQWHATDPKQLYFLPSTGKGMRIHRLNVDTDESIVAADMGEQIKAHWADAANAWTISKGSPSADGRFWCLFAERPSDDGRSWLPRGVFTWDMQTQQIVGTLSLNYRPAFVSTSPSGDYCMVAGIYDHGGTRIYKRDFSTPFSANTADAFLKVGNDAYDADLVFDKQRQDVYVGADYNNGNVVMVDLKQEKQTVLFNGFANGTKAGLQFSGKAFNTPGWVLVTAYGERTDDYRRNLRADDPARQWFHRKVFAISLEESPQVKSLANLHNEWLPMDGIQDWPTPQITVNRDFSRVLFNSTWDSNDPKNVDAYLVAVPTGAVAPAQP
ncbi:MAG: hypothetical protein Q4A16_07215 [Lautropia sp.]|nr:hypothetical protein [Lautropia sp.]